MAIQPALEPRHRAKAFGSATAVAGIDLAAGPGEVFGLLGPNGAGKTSTLRMLCGLLVPTSGWIRGAAHAAWGAAAGARARLGYLDEEPIVYPHLTGREFLNLVADLYGSQRGPDRDPQLKHLFDLFEFADKADELISSYSHGTRQKVGLASVLIHEPEVMLL